MRRAHRLRLACGNGLRPDVWQEFKKRFPHPADLRVLCRDRRQRLVVQFRRQARRHRPAAVVRRATLSRPRSCASTSRRQSRCATHDGFCIECESTSRRGDRQDPEGSSKPGARFEGYAQRAETEKKILRDVFEKGDVWFRTGDLMRKDENGYFYFVDRIGDTFRWKGENVSTTEVEEAIGQFDGIMEANVYGVPVPGRDGRAGMAAIVAEDNLDLAALRDASAQALAGICPAGVPAHPPEIDVTSTFKQKKIELVREGFDPGSTTDPIYFNDPQKKAFVRLDPRSTTRSMGDTYGYERRSGPRRHRYHRTDGRARILARRRTRQVVQEGPGLRLRGRVRFFAAWQSAAAGKLSRWEDTPEGALALTIVLDQFPRNMFRGERRTYEADAMALAVADRALRRGFDRASRIPSAGSSICRSCIRNTCRTRNAAWSSRAAMATMNSRYAEQACRHRSSLRAVSPSQCRLGRATTPEEQAFLDGGGSRLSEAACAGIQALVGAWRTGVLLRRKNVSVLRAAWGSDPEAIRVCGARRRACPRDASAAACAARGAPWRRARPSDGVELISPSRLRYRRVGGAAGAGVRPRKDCGCGRAWGSHPEAIRVGSARRRACPRDASAAACAARGAPWRRARPSDFVELISPSRLRYRRVGGAGGAGVRSRNDRAIGRAWGSDP